MSDARTRTWVYIAGGALLASSACALLFLMLGYYPVALVNNHVVSARFFAKNYRAAMMYANQVQKFNEEVTAARAASTTVVLMSPKELKADVLDQLVESILVEDALADEMSGDEAASIVAEKVGRYDKNAKLRQAAVALFGFNYDDLKERVLIPQAKRDILTGRVYLKGEIFDDWMLERRMQAQVILFTGNVAWTGKKVEAR